MNALVREWLTKAQYDLASTDRELRARKLPNYDAACFHAQQAAEKLLKAVLQDRGIEFPRTHDLADLVSLDAGLPLHGVTIADIRALTRYAVIYRYPGEWSTREDALEARRIARSVRALCLHALGCPEGLDDGALPL